MAYTTSSLTSSTPGKDFIAALGTALAAAGWVKVTAARVEGTFTWDVWKCPGSINSFGTDFYMALGYVTATGLTVKLSVFENWNSSTNVASNFCPNHNVTPNSTTWANPDAAVALPSTGTTLAYMESPSLLTTAMNYGIDVTADRLWFWVGGSGGNTSAFSAYAGLFDPFLPATADAFPICAVQLFPQSSSNGSNGTATPTTTIGVTTRAPLQTGASNAQFSAGAAGAATCAWTLNNSAQAEGYSNKVILCRVLMQGQSAGYYRGLLKDCFMGPTQSQNGDTMTFTLNSVAYTCDRMGGVSSYAIYGRRSS